MKSGRNGKIGLIFLFVIAGCNARKEESKVVTDPIAYKVSIEQWQQKRVEDLKAPNGWLNLIGLHWLENGINTFGSDSGDNIVFPQGKIAAKAGYFKLTNNQVTMEVLKGANITYQSEPVTSFVVFHPDSAHTPLMESGSLRWNIIKRDNKFGIRLRDLEANEVSEFKGIDHYPIEPSWCLKAQVEKSDSTKTIDVTNVLGQTTAQRSPGTIVFAYGGQEFRLDALEGNKEELFIIFADSTTGKETYGAGRFIYVKRPDEHGNTIIDFNKAYNPPCAFTPYATCPLPPKQNILNIAVKAGEKNYGDYNQLKH